MAHLSRCFDGRAPVLAVGRFAPVALVLASAVAASQHGTDPVVRAAAAAVDPHTARAFAAQDNHLLLPYVVSQKTVGYAEVGHIGGRSHALAADGTRAYVGYGPQLVVLDVGDPGAMHELGRSPVLAGQVADIAVVGQVAFVVTASFGDAGTTLHALDVSEPAAPRELGRIDFEGGDLFRQKDRIVVAGDLAYLAYGDVAVADAVAYVSGSDLRIVDVADPAQPRLLGQVIPRRDYVTSDVHIVDVGNPGAPRVLGVHHLTVGFAGAIAATGRTVYATECNDGDTSWYGSRLIVLDATIADAPRETARLDLPAPAVWASIVGDLLYMAEGDGVATGGLTVFDIATPASPRRLQHFDTPTLGDIALDADVAYGVEVKGPIRAFALADGLLGAELGQLDLPRLDAQGVVQADGYAYVAGAGTGVWVVDVSVPRSPRVVARYDVGAAPNSATIYCATGVAVDPPYLYATVGASGGGVCGQARPDRLDVLDVGVPASPRRIASYAFPRSVEYDGCWTGEDSLAVAGDLLYHARGGLAILDISDPAHPRSAGSLAGIRGGCDVAVTGDLAYLTVRRTDDAFKGLVVLDVSDPAAIREVGRQTSHFVANAYGAHRVAVDGTRAYAMEQDAGVQIVDVSDPSRPVEIGFVEVDRWMSGIEIRDGRLFVLGAYRPGSLRVFDVRDPRHIRLAGRHELEGVGPAAIAFLGHRILAATGDDGLRVLDPSDPGASTAWQ